MILCRSITFHINYLSVNIYLSTIRLTMAIDGSRHGGEADRGLIFRRVSIERVVRLDHRSIAIACC